MVVREKKKLSWPVIILIILAPFILRFAVGLFTGHDIEDVQRKIEEHLYQKYGEEFVVTQIGTRSSRGKEFYQARIYPKSIIGTNREWDDYYCASASVSKRSFGRLGGVGDSYGLTKINIGAEEYLLTKTKEIFGERVKLKTEVKYKIRNSHDFYEWNKEPDFLKALNNSKKNSEKIRIELDLDVYIFKRIENEEEKEERRKEIFELVQYLKEEGLFKYLELGVIFIDERVLAPSYKKYNYEISASRKVKEEIDGEIVRMPPVELRKEMSRVLQQEVNEMSEEELLASMRKIRKDELEYDVLDKYNATHYGLIYSAGILEVKYNSSYKKYNKNKRIDHYYYKDISDIKIGKNLEYAYID
ncbi:MAG: hypothetical protein FH762_02435 [Firmicutes bacterium]|nr:hypothetical protein [Bacillota bacterium]